MKLGLLTTLWSILAAWWLLGIAFLVLRYGVLPDINHYKPQIEQEISQALGLKVSIGHLDADWSGLQPELTLTQVLLHNRDNAVALEVPRIQSRLSWWSLPLLAPRFAYLNMESPEIDVARLSEQRWRVAGIDLDVSQPSDSRFAEWLLSQREIVIRGALIRYRDEVRQSPVLELKEITLVLQNSGYQHRVALQATPPATLASPLDIRAEFRHRYFSRNIADWREWSGLAYANFDYADVVALQAYTPWSLVPNTQINSAKGALRAWVQFDQGQLGESTADLALRDVSLQLEKSLPVLNLSQLNGRLLARQFDDQQRHGHEIQLDNLSFQTADGLASAPVSLSERLWFDDQGEISAGRLSASELDLTLLTRLAAFLPLPEQYRSWLGRYAPRGKVQGLSTEWQGPLSKPTHYSLQASFQQLWWRPQAPDPEKAPTAPHHFNFGLPGFENLTGQLQLNERQGELKLNTENAALFFPGVFERERLALDRLVAALDWRRADTGWFVNMQYLSLANQEAAGNFKGTYRSGGKAGIIDMEGQLLRADARAVQHYLPLTIPEVTRHWVKQAVLAGASNDVRFKWQGDLYDWPYHQSGNGQFLISAKLQNAQLKVAADWPLLSDIRGELVFEKNGFRVENAVANTQGLRASAVQVRLPDFSEPSHTLTLRGQLQGGLKAYFDLMKNSPIDQWLHHALSDARGSGEARAEISATLPLSNMAESKVRGTMTFNGNDLKLLPALPSLARTTGKLEFTETGVAARNINTQFLGGNLKLDTPAAALSDGNNRGVHLQGEGTLNLSAASRLLGLDSVFKQSSGSTRYRVQINAERSRLEWGVDSDLTGLTLNLPEPLRKNAAEAMSLRVQSRAGQQPGQEELRLTVGQELAVVLEKNADQRISRGQIQVADSGGLPPALLPAEGLAFNIGLRNIDLDAWNGLFEQEVSTASEASLFGWTWPGQSQVNLKTDELRLAGRRFTRIQANATRRDLSWLINIDSPQIQGQLSWRKGAGTQAANNLGRVVGRFAKLSLPQNETEEVIGLLETAPPQEMPALNIEVEEFELGTKSLGKLELLANNVGRGDSREWQLQKLNMSNPDASLTATGHWSREGAGARRMALNFTLTTANAGNALARFGIKEALRDGASKLEGQVQWRGSPLKIDYPSLNGQLNLSTEKGQFLKADPGVGRLIGVLSLQSLPKRLTLDFRDVFSEGFAFDSIRASAQLRNGVVSTQDFKMRGVNATVLLEGQADLGRETQNLRVLVLPEVNAGGASVIYGLLANPAIGIGTFLAQLLLREPLAKAFSYEYRVTGTWSDPRVERVESKAEATNTTKEVM